MAELAALLNKRQGTSINYILLVPHYLLSVSCRRPTLMAGNLSLWANSFTWWKEGADTPLWLVLIGGVFSCYFEIQKSRGLSLGWYNFNNLAIFTTHYVRYSKTDPNEVNVFHYGSINALIFCLHIKLSKRLDLTCVGRLWSWICNAIFLYTRAISPKIWLKKTKSS